MTKDDFARIWISIVGIIYCICGTLLISITVYAGISHQTEEQLMRYYIACAVVGACGVFSYWFVRPIVYLFLEWLKGNHEH